MLSLTARPSPVPSSTSRVVKKGSKIRSRISSGIPDPGVADLRDDPAVPGLGREGQRAAVRHGLEGVEHQVEEQLLHLEVVGHARRAPSGSSSSRTSTRPLRSWYSTSSTTCRRLWLIDVGSSTIWRWREKSSRLATVRSIRLIPSWIRSR